MNYIRWPLIVASIGIITACQSGKNAGSEKAEEITRFSKLNVNLYPMNKTVCNPLGGGADVRSNGGIKSDLYYISGTPTVPINKIQDVINNGIKADASLFLSNLIVPTRRFERGFSNTLGETIKDNSGNTLIEWFALKMSTIIHLRANQPDGRYEFATLSDDGSIVKMRAGDGTYPTIIDNDGTHPTRLACSQNQVFDMNQATEKLTQIFYHQGPRFHISMIMLMRKVEGPWSADPACGLTGNSTWFNYNTQEPTQNYNNLLARGWEPLTNDNYSLPNVISSFNPCMEGGAVPVISNVVTNENGSNFIMLYWETNIPATSQVAYAPVGSSNSEITTSDNVLRTRHLVTISGLQAQTVYTLRPISISDTYGKAIGNPIDVSTTN